MKTHSQSIPLRIVLVYALIAGAWILFSDRFLDWLVRDPDLLTRLQTYKGWAFVLVTAALLYLVLRGWLRALEREAVERGLAEEELVKFRNAVEQSADIMFITDRDGVIEYVNPAFETITGYSKEEALGKTPRILKLGLMEPEYYQRVWAAILSGEVFRAELIDRKKSGELFYYGQTITPVKDAHGNITHFVSTGKDVTKRKRAEEAAQRTTRALRVLSQFNQMLILADDETSLLREACRLIVETGGYRLAWVGFAQHDEGKTVRPVAHAGFESGYLETLHVTWADTERGRGPTGTAIRTGRPIIARNILTDPNFALWREQALQRGYASAIALPLITGGQTLGALNIYAPEPEAFDDAEVKLLSDLANDLTYGLAALRTRAERKRAEEEIRARNEELAALYAFSTHMRAAESSADLLPIVLSEARRLLQADSGVVTLLSPDRTYFTIALADGGWQANTGRTFPVGQGLSGMVLRSGEPYVSENYSAEPQALPVAHAAETGPAVCVPLRSEVELMGVLTVARHRAPDARPFTPAEVRLLAAIGDMAGNALRRLRLYEDAERRLRQTQALRNIDMAITGSLDLRVTFNVALDEIVHQLGIDAATILRLDPHSQTLEYAAGRGFRTRAIEQTRLRLGEDHAGRAALERRIVHIPNLPETGSEFVRVSLLAGEGFVEYYAVPLIAKGHVQGVLEVFHRSRVEATDEWEAFLETLAGQTAIAIDNAALFHGLERANIELVQAYDATIEGWSRALDCATKRPRATPSASPN